MTIPSVTHTGIHYSSETEGCKEDKDPPLTPLEQRLRRRSFVFFYSRA